MSRLRQIYNRIQAINHRVIDRSLAAALPTADPLSLKLIALSLLQRDDPDAQAQLLRRYDQLPRDIRATIIRHAKDLYEPLRRLARLPADEGPLNAIAIVNAAKLTDATYLAAEQLFHRPTPVREQAAACLLDLANWVATPLGNPGEPAQPHADAACAHHVQTAVEEAVNHFRGHKQPDTLLALAALTPRSMPMGALYLGERHHAASEAMRTLLADAADPETRRALLAFIRIPALTDAALLGLTTTAASARIAEIMPTTHLLLNPRAVKALAKASRPTHLWPTPEQHAAMTPAQSRGLARWAVALPIEPAQRIKRLAKLSTTPDSAARLSALRALMAIPLPTADHAVTRFCHDHDERIARIALRHLIRRQWDGLSPLMLDLLGSDHPSVRQLASRKLAPAGFKRLWTGWSHMSEPQRIATGRALIKIDPLLHEHLAAKLNAPLRDDRIRALEIIQGLNQAAFFQGSVAALFDEPDQVVAATAARVLGTVHSDFAVQALETALDHPDTRVRANAVEALRQLQATGHLQRLAEIAQNDENRPRANAIAALMQMQTADAMKSLADMLHDPRPKQRASALWLIESMGLIEVARHAAEMSVSDPDQKVQSRARSAVQHLIKLMADPNPNPESQTNTQTDTQPDTQSDTQSQQTLASA